MRKAILLAPMLALTLQGCGPMLAAMAGGMAASAPPQAPAAVAEISRGALDFALNSFDAALYGFDFAMDLGKPAPGSPEAKRIAAAGRKVMSFLGAAEAARAIGNSATYEEAFRKAGEALSEFRAGLGLSAQPASLSEHTAIAVSFTWAKRAAILDRADSAPTF
jgi:hypothetical protein